MSDKYDDYELNLHTAIKNLRLVISKLNEDVGYELTADETRLALISILWALMAIDLMLEERLGLTRVKT
jgi:hypothetical protein